VFRHRSEHPALQAYRVANAGKPDVQLTEITALTPSAVSSQAAGVPTGTVGLPGVRITDVATHPLGIVVLDGTLKERIINLIPEFTPLPCDKRGRFAYAYDNMTAVRVEITEGHGENRDEVVVIGEVILDHLPPRPRGTPIEVVYRYTVNQILEVDVTDVETRQMRRARINLRGSINEDQKAFARERIRRASIT
jgi:molecular chaperone DnaK